MRATKLRLTPYLGQLRKLRQALGSVFAVIISNRDMGDLENEGLELEPLQLSKMTLLKALRLSTVDNFQGEEAKVVIKWASCEHPTESMCCWRPQSTDNTFWATQRQPERS